MRFRTQVIFRRLLYYLQNSDVSFRLPIIDFLSFLTMLECLAVTFLIIKVYLKNGILKDRSALLLTTLISH